MTFRIVGVATALVLALASAHARAADIWVDQAAAAGGDGSQAKPFSTINAAKAVLKTGDTVWIKSGTYKETVDCWQLPAGTGGRTVIRAAKGANVVIDGGGASGFVLQAGQTPDMTFEGLTVKNGSTGIEFYKADGGPTRPTRTAAGRARRGRGPATCRAILPSRARGTCPRRISSSLLARPRSTRARRCRA